MHKYLLFFRREGDLSPLLFLACQAACSDKDLVWIWGGHYLFFLLVGVPLKIHSRLKGPRLFFFQTSIDSKFCNVFFSPFSCQRGSPLTADDSSIVKDEVARFPSPLPNNLMTVRLVGEHPAEHAENLGAQQTPEWAKFGPLVC